MKLKCAMCGGESVIGLTQATAFASNNDVPIDFELFDSSTLKVESFSGVRRLSVCVDCGHVALFVSESVRKKLREKAATLQPMPDDSE